jgi:uncharacterized membrane protein YdbT with pleckstrin-like domain
MGYPQELLSQGETVEFEMRPHWRALLMPITIIVAVLIAVGVIAAMWGSWFEGSVGTIGRWIFLGVGLVVVTMFAVKPLAYWFTTQYVFTDRRIIIRRGLVAREGRDMPLSKVNNVSFSVSVPGRLLNYGRLSIDSASDEELVIDDVPNVEFIQREVNRLHEEDDARRRRDLAEEQ